MSMPIDWLDIIINVNQFKVVAGVFSSNSSADNSAGDIYQEDNAVF